MIRVTTILRNDAMSRLKLASIAMLAAAVSAPAADWPQWGRDSTRNAVSLEKGAPLAFQLPSVENGKLSKPERAIAWFGELGSRTIGTPSISDGLVWIGTNAREPSDAAPRKDWDGGVLMCFRESDGKLVWKHRSPRLGTGIIEDFPLWALGSAPSAYERDARLAGSLSWPGEVSTDSAREIAVVGCRSVPQTFSVPG